MQYDQPKKVFNHHKKTVCSMAKSKTQSDIVASGTYFIYIYNYFKKKKDLVMNHFTYFLLNLIRYYIREKI